MTVDSVVLEVPDVAEATEFHRKAFDLDDRVDVRQATSAEPSGFRGFTLSLVVPQPGTVDSLTSSALDAGATEVRAPAKSFWGYGAVVQAPDGTIWKLATSAKRDKEPATRRIDDIALLLGVADVKATKRFYTEHGLEVGKAFGSKYVEFASPSGVKLALYGRRALAKDAGVPETGSGPHRVVLRGSIGPLTDPDGFVWEAS